MITLSSQSIDFGTLSKSQSSSKLVTAFNASSVDVNVTGITSTSLDYSAGPTVFIVPAHGYFDFVIKYIASIPLTATGQIAVQNSAGPDVLIDVTATVLTPTVSINTGAINFDKVGVDDTKTVTKTIQNTSVDDAVLTLTIASTDSNFRVSVASIEIQSGDSFDLDVIFAPVSVGVFSGSVNIVANDAIGNYSFNVDGESLQPTYIVSTTSINFGSVAINSTGQMFVDLTNTDADVNLLVSSVTIADSDITVDVSVVKLLPGQTQTFTVSFVPTTPAILLNSLSIITNAGNISINYQGVGLVIPLMTLDKSLVDYGKYPLNDDRIIQLTVASTGVVDLSLTGIVFPTVSDTTFSVTPVLPLIIPRGESLTFDLKVNSITSVDYTDVITINSDAIGNPHTISLTGSARSPIIRVSTDKLDFGTLSVGDTRILSFDISNDGEVALNASIANTDHFIVSSNSFVVDVAQTITITVAFSLDAPGDVTENLIILSNDVAHPSVTVVASGGANFDHAFRVIPESVISNFISKNIEEVVQLTIINVSLYDATIDDFIDNKLPDVTASYTILIDTLPLTLSPGEAQIVSVKILASTVGTVGGYLKFNTRVGSTLQFNTSITVDYSGEVFSPAIQLSSSSITFDDTAIGYTTYKPLIIANDSSEADLIVTLTSNSDKFNFKSSAVQNLTPTLSNSKYIVSTGQANLVLQSVTLVDNITGDVLVQGDPSIAGQFSVNTITGALTLNQADKDRQLKTQYDYKLSSVILQVSKKSNVTIFVGFSPDIVGAISGTLTVSSNDGSSPVSTINVQGNGLAAVAQLQQVNDLVKYESKVGDPLGQKVVLKNTGTVQLFVSSVDIVAPFTVDETKFVIDPNETHELDIVFIATDNILVTQDIVIHSNAPDLTVSVAGQGAYPQISVPAVLDFDESGLNVTKDLTLTITNLGSADLDVQISIDSDIFTISPSITTVKALETYDIVVSFTPIDEVTYTATLDFASDDPAQPHVSVSVTGNGVKKPIIQVPNKITFDDTNVREVDQHTLTIQNIGTDPLSITNVAVTVNLNSFSIDFAPDIVAPGSSKDYTIKFTPKQAGTINGTINVTSNDTSHPNVNVLLKGKAIQPKGEWESFNLQDMLPDPVISLAEGVDAVIGPLKTMLNLIKQVLNIVKVLLIDTSNLLKPLLEMVQKSIENFVEDLKATGLYLLPLYPSTAFNDPNVKAKTAFGKYLASIGGGSEKFKQRIADSFDDVYDSKRPQFPDSSDVGAIVIAVDSGNAADVVKGIMSLSQIFTSLKWNPEVEPPSNVTAIAGDGQVVVRWNMPEAVSFSVGDIVNNIKMLDILSVFDVYRSEYQSRMVIATEQHRDSNNQVISDKGDVIDPVTFAKINKIGTVSEMLGPLVQNMPLGWSDPNSTAVNSNSYVYLDKAVTNGTTYYYAIRSKMAPSANAAASPLSAETSAVPQGTVNEGSFLDRCSFFTCIRKTQINREFVTLGSPKVKMIDRTGIIQQTDSRFQSDKITPNANYQQVNVFTMTLLASNVDISYLKVRNTTEAERRLKKNNQDIDVKQFVDNGLIDAWDDNSVAAEGRDVYFDALNATKLVPGWDLLVSPTDNKTILTISDISDIGYTQGDIVVIEYYVYEYEPFCSNTIYSSNFNEKTCAVGTTNCQGLDKKKRCIFHGGTVCLNAGNTKVPVNRCIPNKTFFDVVRCQDGTMGGHVPFFYKQFRNDSTYCVATTGVCAGYTALDETSVGAYPNWSSISAIALIQPLEQFIDDMNKWVNKEIDGIQKGSESVTQFIDLLGQKIDALGAFIDKLQMIIDVFNSIFSSDVGFHILKIEIDSGGVTRIKNIVQSAEGGPNSGSTGYTAGIVLLAGGSTAKKVWQFLQMLF
jgi:hypothetical protein